MSYLKFGDMSRPTTDTREFYRNLGIPASIRVGTFWVDHKGYFPEVVRLLVESALTRGDVDTAEMFLSDYQAEQKKPVAQVSKFVPGDHFYVLGKRFDSLAGATEYANNQGYRVGSDVHLAYVSTTLGGD